MGKNSRDADGGEGEPAAKRPRRGSFIPTIGKAEERTTKGIGGKKMQVRFVDETVDGLVEINRLMEALDSERGILLSSTYEYPNRYTRWDLGFRNPPIALESSGLTFRLLALNERGEKVLFPFCSAVIKGCSAVETFKEESPTEASGTVKAATGRFPEEQRSRQPSIFSLIRSLIDAFGMEDDGLLGLYGAFGYDLAFQFEPIKQRFDRTGLRDLVMYIPDEVYMVDHKKEEAYRRRYEFSCDGASTDGLMRTGARNVYVGGGAVARDCDHRTNQFTDKVRLAKEKFRAGDLFEVVPGQTFFESCSTLPSELFRTLRERNPAPYGFICNLGSAEYLVGASPEMYVRVEGRRVETCPISGTCKRGKTPMEDAENIKQLLNSEKEESELSMCTDVDRNDKSRICVPGSVKVIGRRQIEMYSRLIHTVDHVEGTLRDDYDALDAFMTHMWAVTVTGAPKARAMQFLEDNEESPRAWYGGAVGQLRFDGGMNTALTLRTIRLANGVAEIRAGATLLYDSVPELEEEETRIKAAAFLDVLRRPRGVPLPADPMDFTVTDRWKNKTILLIDHDDSFVHTLANYLRQTGATVTTLRHGFSMADTPLPDLAVLSPGPGRPADFHLSDVLKFYTDKKVPVFGVCLGMQAMQEFYGGKLDVLSYPVHGKPSPIRLVGDASDSAVFKGFPEKFVVGRYHSLYATKGTIPDVLRVTAETEKDGVVMALEHKTLPVAGVQFHPESILTPGSLGLRMLSNVLAKFLA